jgi:hypothetical protein
VTAPLLSTDPRLAELEAAARTSVDSFSEGAVALARAAKMMIDAASSAANERPGDASAPVQVLAQIAQTLDACRAAVEPLVTSMRNLGLVADNDAQA